MMRPSISTATAMFVWIVAAIGAPQWADANPAVYELGNDPAVGFNLISWWNFGGSGVSTWENAVQDVYNAGFRSVSISPVRYVTVGTGVIATTSQKGPELSHISAAVARAKSLGMRVTLNPFVEPSDSSWRGFYNPAPGGAEATQFWSDYQNYVVAVSQIANTYNVDAFTIGTELKALDDTAGHNASWQSLITAVRGVFHGPLGYAANWDDYQNANLRTTVWENPDIDFIGIDSYFTNLVSTAQANASGTYPNATFINTVTTAWNNKFNNEILPYAAARKSNKGMPVAFTEAGYLPYNGTSRTPQNSSNQPLDTDEQKMAFNGLMNALDGRASLFRGVDVWAWAMPGSDGNIWNMDPTSPADQANNIPAAQWLQSFVGTAVLPLAGDYDHDGAVSTADYVVWRKNLGKYVTQYNGADGSGNGIIDQPDYNVWRDHFNAPLGSGASALTAIPEPTAATLLLCSFCLMCATYLVRQRDGTFRRVKHMPSHCIMHTCTV
jgi:GTA TIM-barrel-like domain